MLNKKNKKTTLRCFFINVADNPATHPSKPSP